MTDLKPCPFCPDGGSPALARPHTAPNEVAVYCGKCMVVTATYPSEAEAIAAWNRRSPQGEEAETRGWTSVSLPTPASPTTVRLESNRWRRALLDLARIGPPEAP